VPKITELPDAQVGTEGDLYPIVQAGVNRKQTRTQLRAALGANIVALAALIGAADKLAYFTAAGTMALASLTAVGRQIIAMASLSDLRAAMGIGATTGRNLLINSNFLINQR